MNTETLTILSAFAPLILVIGVPLILAVVAAFRFIGSMERGNQRTVDLRSFAYTTGMNFIGDNSLSNIPGYDYFDLFRLGSAKTSLITFTSPIKNTIIGFVNGFQVSAFDYSYRVGRNANSRTKRQTVIMSDSQRLSLPSFTLQPKGTRSLIYLFDVLNVFGKEIDFSSNPFFSGKYTISGKDEKRIRQIFDVKKLSYFDTIEGFTVEGAGSRIIFYKDDMLAEPNQISLMINEAVKIASLFAH